ncbi:MAG: sugar phosphate nucleotidyltransferase [Candidatus Kapaibacterium sp.]
MRAVIPVAGVGTRLRPHTYTLPKVLLNVAGKPILAHILDALKEQGIKKASIVYGYMGEMVIDFVKERYSDMEVDFVEQEEAKGLGHAIWSARDTFGNDPLMIILGDTVFDVDLSLARISGGSSLGVKKVEDQRRFGVVLLDDDGNVTRMVEKPEEPISKLALVGIYYITNPVLLRESLEDLIVKDIKTRGEYQLTDALQIMIEKGEKFKTFRVEGWYDCGKRETLLSTNRYLLDKFPKEYKIEGSVIIPPCHIAPDAKIVNSVVGPYVTVADGGRVQDSIVRNSILSNGANVSLSLLEKSIIGNHAIVNGHFHSFNVGSSSEIDRS